jgi:prepilin-type N-terminal cleavage/methylation domain-containing protein
MLIRNTNKNYFLLIAHPKASGFTLIELLVVIAIIGLLASIALVSLSAARVKSRDAKRTGDLNQFGKALELYFNNYNTYPTASGPLSSLTSALGQPSIVPAQINKIPVEPTPNDGSCAVSGQSSNQYYWVPNNTSNTANNYAITFCLGTGAGSLQPGPHTLTSAGFQ